jgi:hypothetical protein
MVTELKIFDTHKSGNMEALYPVTTNFNSKPYKREEAMNTTSTALQHLEMPGQGVVNESKVKSIRKHKAYGPVINVIISVLLILAGISVLKVTGLYDGMESVIGKIGLVAGISVGYLIAFRRGYYA